MQNGRETQFGLHAPPTREGPLEPINERMRIRLLWSDHQKEGATKRAQIERQLEHEMDNIDRFTNESLRQYWRERYARRMARKAKRERSMNGDS
jgi:hypothetical protein